MTAFAVALLQNDALLGSRGLLPACSFMARVMGSHDFESPDTTWTSALGKIPASVQLYRSVPTLFWWLGCSDAMLRGVACAGVVLAGFVALSGRANVPIMAALWVLYHSLVKVGQTWYSFGACARVHGCAIVLDLCGLKADGLGCRNATTGWESQLLETGFLCIFLVPVFSLARFPRHTPTPVVVVWAQRWLVFRLMLGAVRAWLHVLLAAPVVTPPCVFQGLIKIRGDQCWRDLTCMVYHYGGDLCTRTAAIKCAEQWCAAAAETQPVPNPMSWAFHVYFPLWLQKASTMVNHIVELPAPFLLLMPRAWRTVGGVIQVCSAFAIAPFAALCCNAFDLAQIGFQLTLIVSGNLSFLNHLTIAPCLFCFDDSTLSILFSKSTCEHVALLQRDRSAQGTTFIGSVFSRQHRRTKRADGPSLWVRWNATCRMVVSVGLAALIVSRSVPVVANMLSSRQVMNTSFDPFSLVNTYGAFGSITKDRHEVVLQGTALSNPSEADWLGERCQLRELGVRRILTGWVVQTTSFRARCGIHRPRGFRRAALSIFAHGLTRWFTCSLVMSTGAHASFLHTTTGWTGCCGSLRSRTTNGSRGWPTS